jgi:hypothetical protein
MRILGLALLTVGVGWGNVMTSQVVIPASVTGNGSASNSVMIYVPAPLRAGQDFIGFPIPAQPCAFNPSLGCNGYSYISESFTIELDGQIYSSGAQDGTIRPLNGGFVFDYGDNYNSSIGFGPGTYTITFTIGQGGVDPAVTFAGAYSLSTGTADDPMFTIISSPEPGTAALFGFAMASLVSSGLARAAGGVYVEIQAIRHGGGILLL